MKRKIFCILFGLVITTLSIPLVLFLISLRWDIGFTNPEKDKDAQKLVDEANEAIYSEGGEHDGEKAYSFYKAALRLHPSREKKAEILNLIADFHCYDYCDGLPYWNLPKAIRIAKGVIRKYPETKGAIEAHKILAYCYYKSKKYQKAIALYKKFIELVKKAPTKYPDEGDEEKAWVQFCIGICYKHLNDTSLALRELQKVIDDYPNVTRRVNRAKEEIEEIKQSMAKLENS